MKFNRRPKRSKLRFVFDLFVLLMAIMNIVHTDTTVWWLLGMSWLVVLMWVSDGILWMLSKRNEKRL